MTKRKRKQSKKEVIKEYKSILCISDLHCPYEHPDSFEFLKAVKQKYKPDKVVCLGDEVDHHAMSFHDSDPDLPSAGDELLEAIEHLKPLYKLFPKVDVLDSNHGSMHYRKGKHHGIPRKYLRSYEEILEAPKGWKWHNDLIVRSSDGNDIYFHHGRGANVLKVSQEMSMRVVQGHYHNTFAIQYWGNPNNLYWGMQVGCSIDDKSLAFAYNKLIAKRPIIGHGIIVNGYPKLLPIVLDKHGRWIGKLV